MTQSGGDDPVLFISTDGHKPPDHRGAAGPVLVCRLYDHELLGIVGTIKDAPPATDLVEGEEYLLVCTLDGEVVRIAVVTYDPNRFVVDPATLAQTAARSLPLLYPVPSTAPPSDQTQLVGVATWLWIDAQDFTDVSASISIANLRVTATAHPARVLWDLGDGSETVVCDGPGTPYRADVADADQHTDCRHAFTRAGAFKTAVSIEWDVTWTASNGAGGTLAPIRRGVTMPVAVDERQAVITG